MKSVLLANVDYRLHMTSEGDQFQEGLRSAGWQLCGVGYDGLTDVPAILNRYRPGRVVVHDKRDWDPQSSIAFRKDLGFTRLSALKASRAFKAVVVKDAASSLPYQKAFFEEVAADAAIVYYHERSVTTHGMWLEGKPLIRTYHSISEEDLACVPLYRPRATAVVTGASSNAYPLRQRVIRDAHGLGVTVLRHPGYGNQGARTPDYLRQIANYKVHVATASMYGFALRKIIESVAVGCTVVTDLPAYDVLPEIDGALVRVKPTIGTNEVHDVIQSAVRSWDLEERLVWAEKARRFYNHEAIGKRLDGILSEATAAVRA